MTFAMMPRCGSNTVLGALVVVLAASNSAMPSKPAQVASLLAHAKLNQDGYATVASLKSDDAMKVFVERYVKSVGKRVDDSSALSGWVPYFSGRLSTQSFAKMSEELQHAKWVVEDSKAALAKTNLLRKALAPEPRSASANTSSAAVQSAVPVFTGDTVALLKDVTSKADAMEERVTAMHTQARRELEKKKQAYETNLQAQKAKTDLVEDENQNILFDTREVRKETEALKIEAEGYMKACDLLKDQLVHMLSKVALAGSFLEASVNDTANATEADRLEELLAPPRRDLEFYVEEARRSLRPVSLLQLQSRGGGEANSTRDELLGSLADSLEKVEKATLEGAARLKASYVASSKLLEEEKANLTKLQGELMDDRAKAESEMREMKTAVDYLQSAYFTTGQHIAAAQAFLVKLQNGVEAVVLEARTLTQKGEQ